MDDPPQLRSSDVSRHHPSLGVIVGLIVVATSLGSAPALAAYPGEEGRIAFVRGGEIWTAATDGSEELRLTRVGAAFTPVWSPDGRRIAFTWYRPALGTRADIWTMAADGSDKRQVTAERAWETYPTWSPNGRWIAFSSDREEIGFGAFAIYKIRSSVLDATPRLLTDGGLSSGGLESINDTDPAWSPLGDVILFQRNFNDGGCAECSFAELWTITPDGENETRLPSTGREPAWSPHGRRIAYAEETIGPLEIAESYNNIFHVHPDGTDVRQVTHFGSGNWFYARRPAWSPDEGRRIVFDLANFVDGNLGIAMIGSRGLGSPALIIENGYDPDWQPLPTGHQ